MQSREDEDEAPPETEKETEVHRWLGLGQVVEEGGDANQVQVDGAEAVFGVFELGIPEVMPGKD